MKYFACAAIALAVLSVTSAQVCSTGKTKNSAARSCAAVLECKIKAKDGLYWILAKNDEGELVPTKMNCDMGTVRCGVKGGWTTLVEIDMTIPNQACELNGSENITVEGETMCRKNSSGGGCAGQTYGLSGRTYTEVCGMARAFSWGSPDTAPAPIGTKRGLDEIYADGLSITHGPAPRKHIWTYIGGWTEETDLESSPHACPCAKGGEPLKHNAYIGNHYYCESANPESDSYAREWFMDDALWDGEGCKEGNSCCSNSGAPYFHRILPQRTSDHVEARLCCDQGRSDEDLGLQKLALYVR